MLCGTRKPPPANSIDNCGIIDELYFVLLSLQRSKPTRFVNDLPVNIIYYKEHILYF